MSEGVDAQGEMLERPSVLIVTVPLGPGVRVTELVTVKIDEYGDCEVALVGHSIGRVSISVIVVFVEDEGVIRIVDRIKDGYCVDRMIVVLELVPVQVSPSHDT